MGKTRVAIVVTSFNGGGAEKSMSALAEALAADSLEVALIAINRGHEPLVDSRVTSYLVGRKWKGSWLNLVIAIIRFNLILWRLKPTIVIANCELSEFMVAFSAIGNNIIIVDHSLNTWMKNPRLAKLVKLLLKFRTVAIVRVSEQVPLRPSWGVMDSVIKNPVSRPNVCRASELSDTPRFIFIGRLSREKNPSEFFKIVDAIDHPTLVIGDGPLRNELENSHSSHEFLGHKLDPWNYVQENDLLLFTSLSEGDGLAVLEAMSAGVPILMRDAPHYRKFRFADRFYYGSISEARQKLKDFKDARLDLKTPSDLMKSVLSERNVTVIAEEWRQLFSTLDSVQKLH